MTPAELARDKLKYWGYINRAKNVGFPIPFHWMRYGFAPKSATEISSVCLDSISDKFKNLFDNDDYFYNAIKK